MNLLLSCQELGKHFGARELFSGLSFGVEEGERLGLIGPNGSGKSTLLKILAGEERADEGKVIPKRGLRVALVAQSQATAWPVEASPRSVLMRSQDEPGLEEHVREERAERALQEGGFPDPEASAPTLSGGWRKRLAILEQVVRQPDLLLVDEPTNHMDLEGVLWLEDLLARSGLSQVIVTHDRGFLERVCSRVLEVNRGYPEGFFACQGSYSQFLERRAAFFASQAEQESSLSNSVRREVEWLRRGAKARSTKQQARIDRAGGMIEALDDLKQRNSLNRTISIDFGASGRETRRLVELIHAQKSMGGRPLFGPLDLLLSPGSRLGLLGPNGSGKTTLLRLLAGEIEPDQGTVKRAERLEVVRFDQHREQLDMKQSLKEALAGAGEHVHLRGNPIHVAGWAKRFLFRAEQLDMPLSRLSGGEQSRVLIARLMLKSADLLLLDEPTNDLDLPSLEVLEQSLLDFPGALVLVTHDRWLLDRVCQRLLALDGLGAAEQLASLEQWEAWRRGRGQARPAKKAGPAPKPAATAAALPTAPAPAALNARERAELRGMEASISAAEALASSARQALADPAVASDAEALLERHRLLEAAEAKVAALFARWEELEAKQGQAK